MQKFLQSVPALKKLMACFKKQAVQTFVSDFTICFHSTENIQRRVNIHILDT